MNLKAPLTFVTLATILAACVTPNNASKHGIGGKTVVGNYHVNWNQIPALKNAKNDGLTALIFSFSHANPSAQNGITEADWEREAKRVGMPVADVRQHLYGGSAYKNTNGQLAVCTINAIDKGLCGNKLNLTVKQRVEIAKNLVNANVKCTWAGFDPSYNTIQSYRLGAASHSLHIRAKC